MSKSDLAREIVQKYIDLGIKHKTSYSKRFIATVLQSEHPDIFKDVEDARAMVRTVTGMKGNRKYKINEEITRDFALLEMPIREFEVINRMIVNGKIF